jgi:hypothetical protein
MSARERQPDVLRLRGVQNVLVLRPSPIRPSPSEARKTTGPESTAKQHVCASYLRHDELVDHPALPVVDSDLVAGDSGAGRPRSLLQLGGARPRVPGSGRRRREK